MTEPNDVLARLSRAESLTRRPLYSLAIEAMETIERLVAENETLQAAIAQNILDTGGELGGQDATIARLKAAGQQLNRALMALHPAHHGPKCDTCAALDAWWLANNPDAAWAVNL